MPSAGSGPAFFVSPSGNDSNPGSQIAPWRTIAKAALTPPWSRVYVRSGSYNESVTINNPGVALEGWPGDTLKPLIWAQNQEEKPSWVIRFGINADDCLLRNLEIQGGSYYCIKTESNWNWGGGMLPEQRHGSSRLTVESCKIHGSGRDCFKFTPGSRDCVVRNCEIFDSGLRDPSNAEGIDAVNCDRLWVVGNHIHDIATNGVYVKGGSIGSVIENNQSYERD